MSQNNNAPRPRVLLAKIRRNSLIATVKTQIAARAKPKAEAK